MICPLLIWPFSHFIERAPRVLMARLLNQIVGKKRHAKLDKTLLLPLIYYISKILWLKLSYVIK